MITLGVAPAKSTANKQQNYSAVVAPYSTTANDQLLSISGTSGTITLHTAVGNTGQVMTLEHLGTSLTQVYTLNTTSGQTIGGIASGSYALYTNQEVLTIYSDGSNWQIEHHQARTGITSGTATITGTTTNPTKGTMTTDLFTWYRDGRYAHCNYRYIATTAGAAGSGVYLVTPINSLTIDTAFQNVDSGTSTLSIGLSLIEGAAIYGQANTASVTVGGVYAHSSTAIKFGGLVGGAINYWGSAGNPLSGTNVQMNAWFTLPIVGWQP